MKKLMIAMSAAAMMSLCAQAAPQGGVSLETGTKFNSYQGTWAPDKDDNGLRSGTVYWTGGGGDSSIEVKSASDKYLKVDETAELTRKIKVVNDMLEPQSVASSSIYFSSQVQFTAMDGEPAVSNGVDKIIVWAKAPDEEQGGTTNLMVTAWDATGNVTNVDTEITIDAETWYDLEIVASPSAGDNPISPISFMVKLGNNSAVGPFFSMVDEGSAATTISSASFKGTGAVDDIDWGTVAAAPDVTVTVEPPQDVAVYTDSDATQLYSQPIVVKAGQPVTVYVADDYGTLVVSSTAGTVGTWDEVNSVWPVTYTTDAEHLAVTMTITATDSASTIQPANVVLSDTEAVYREGLQLPEVTVTIGGNTLTENTDYTVEWVPAEITAEGGTFTVTVTGINNYVGVVVKTFTVTPAGGDKAKVGDTEYANGADFVAAATSGTVNTLPSGWTVDGNVVKDGTGATFATFPAFYNVTLTGTTLTLELNNNALATMTAVTVGETFGLSVSASDTKLYYGLSYSTTVTGDYTAPTALVPGTGNALTIPAAKSGSGNQCFYKLYVTDIAPAPAQD